MAYDLTKPLIDFIDDHSDDPDFGSIWVAYTNGVQVHARTTGEPSIAADVAALERQTGVEIEHHIVDGSSWQQLHDLSRTISDRGLDVGYSINHELGTFDVFSGRALLDNLDLDTVMIREVPGSDEVFAPLAASAGDSVRYQVTGWVPDCTAGMMYEGPGFKGYLTAAHCRDSRSYVYGSYSVPSNALRYESCTPQDVQLKDFNSAAPTPTNWLREPQPGYYIGALYALAGGYYIGQPGYAVGAYTNPVIGSVSVSGWGSVLVDAVNDCPVSSRGFLQLSAMVHPGDSGGPVALVYDYKLFLASSLIAGSGTFAVGSWLNWVSIPGGGHACTSLTPC